MRIVYVFVVRGKSFFNMQISSDEKRRLVGNAKPIDPNNLKQIASQKVMIIGLNDGDIIEFPSPLEMYEYDVQGTTTNIVLCRINKHAARFFLSNFVNAGFPVIDRGKATKDDCAEPSTGVPYLEDEKGYIVLHNIGKVYEDWANADSLADALENLAGHKVKVTVKEWYSTRWQKKPVLEFEYAD